MLFTGASGNEPKNQFELFLQNYAWILCIAVVVAIILTIAIVFLIKNRKPTKQKKAISTASPNEWVDALGGQENILEVSSAGSRLSIQIKNPELVNRESLTKLGVTSIVMMSNKITLVTNLNNQLIEEQLKNHLEN